MSTLRCVDNLLAIFSDSRLPLNDEDGDEKDWRYKEWGGTTFYAQQGDKLEDYYPLKVSGSRFIYNCKQHTLICGECDFSFTSSVIQKRGGSGINLYTTCWYYFQSQWFRKILCSATSSVSEFNHFIKNLKFCEKSKSKICFGVDATLLHVTAAKYKWHNKFDRIMFTFPRVYTWDKSKYDRNNQMFIIAVLESMKYCLKENGEIHLMLFREQFWNWQFKEILNTLDMKLSYWAKLNQSLLGIHFGGYTPRDTWGNIMKLQDDTNGTEYTIYFCSFVRNKKDYKSTTMQHRGKQTKNIKQEKEANYVSKRKQSDNKVCTLSKCIRCGIYNSTSSAQCVACFKYQMFPCKKCGLLNPDSIKNCSACYEPLISTN